MRKKSSTNNDATMTTKAPDINTRRINNKKKNNKLYWFKCSSRNQG